MKFNYFSFPFIKCLLGQLLLVNNLAKIKLNYPSLPVSIGSRRDLRNRNICLIEFQSVKTFSRARRENLGGSRSCCGMSPILPVIPRLLAVPVDSLLLEL